jgi:hypothetical protein
MKMNRVASAAMNEDAFQRLVEEFGFNDETISIDKRERLVNKLIKRIENIKQTWVKTGKIVKMTKATSNSAVRSNTIQHVQFADWFLRMDAE